MGGLVKNDKTRSLEAMQSFVCMSRCKDGSKPNEEMHGLPPEEEYNHTPAEWTSYFEAARRCAAPELQRATTALGKLNECGVVHVRSGEIITHSLLKQLSAEYERLHSTVGA